MGSGNTQKNKPHKTKFSSKSQRNKHKLAKEAVGGPTRGGARGVGSSARAQRLLRNKQAREQKRAEHLANKRAATGPSAPPRILVLLGLSTQVDLTRLKTNLIAASRSLDGEISSANGIDANDVAMDDVDASGDGEKDLAGGVKGLSGAVSVIVARHKLRLTIMEARTNDVLHCLEAIKVADVIAFVVPTVPPSGATEALHVDAWGKKVLSLARAQGLPSTVGFLQGLTELPVKRRADAKKSAMATLSKEFPDEFKTFAVDSPEDCQQLFRHLADNSPSPPVWRTQRPYVVAHQVDFVPNPVSPGVGTLQVAGYLRGRGISVNQLVHVAGHGDFQLSQIDGPEDPVPLQKRQRKAADVSMADADSAPAVLAVANPSLQEPLVVENTPDPLAGEQTWPTKEELAAAGKGRKVKRVPKGTSAYQAAWFIGASDDEEGSEEEGGEAEGEEGGGDGEAMAMGDGDQDDGPMARGRKGKGKMAKGKKISDAGGDGEGEEGEGEGEDDEEDDEEEEDDSEWEDLETDGKSIAGLTSQAPSVWGEDHAELMEEDEGMTAAQREADLQRLKKLHEEDQEFPDEVDTPLDVAARERFAKYRGLKSFRTSPWDPKESLPVEYSRIFSFESFKRTQKLVMKRAAHAERTAAEGLVALGPFVRLHIANVPQQAAERAAAEAQQLPLVVCGLLPHETKMSVLHFGVRKADSYAEPLRSKETLLFHSGFRRFTTRPIFSTDDLALDKHKLERFLHPARFSIASVFAPIAFPPQPLLVFKEKDDGVQLAATGALRESNPDRIILKKIVLSGYPLSVSKRKAVVKYMFHDSHDVRWFKPVELYTKYGRRGRIMEPVGEKGNMKCIFDGVVQQRDAVCMSLYKRAYPKWPEPTA